MRAGLARRGLFVLAAAVAPGACTRRAPAPVAGTPVYTVGQAYRTGATWFYPREQFQYAATGLAVVQAAHPGATADGERPDPAAMTAAHPTLQLPAVVRVTNLENGRSALVRLNDRGPSQVGRLIALSPRAAAVLGAGAGTRVRVELDEAMSHAVADAVGGAPSLAIQAVPVQAIRAEALAPPAGATQSARVRTAPASFRPAATAAAEVAAVPDRLPETVTQGAADSGALYVRASEFGRMDYAQDQRRRLPGLPVEVERVHEPRQDRFRVRAGPFATVTQADAALQQALNAGVADARIVVE